MSCPCSPNKNVYGISGNVSYNVDKDIGFIFLETLQENARQKTY